MSAGLRAAAAIFVLVIMASTGAQAQPAAAAQEDARPTPCFEGMCPVCSKLGPLATIWACTAVIDDKATETSARAEAYAERGTAHGLRKEYHEQIADLTSAISELQRYMARHHLRQSSFLPGYYLNRALAHYHARKWAEAIDDLEKSAPEGIGGPGAESEYHAMARWHLGQYDQALKEIDAAMTADDPWPTPWFERGLIKASMKNYRGAVDDFSKAIAILRAEIAQDHDPAETRFLAVALFQRSLARRQAGDIAGADADLAEAKSFDAGYANTDEF